MSIRDWFRPNAETKGFVADLNTVALCGPLFSRPKTLHSLIFTGAVIVAGSAESASTLPAGVAPSKGMTPLAVSRMLPPDAHRFCCSVDSVIVKFPARCAAPNRASLLHQPDCVGSIKEVAVDAVCFAGVPNAHSLPASDVLAYGHDFQVGGVDTAGISAEMIDGQPIGDRSHSNLIGTAVGVIVIAIVPGITIASSGQLSWPVPTPIWVGRKGNQERRNVLSIHTRNLNTLPIFYKPRFG
jgi:hypothetical protein